MSIGWAQARQGRVRPQRPTQVVDQWVADLLGMSVSTVWRPGVAVVGHAGLGEYPGFWVIRRADALRVSVPQGTDDAVDRRAR